MSISRSSVVALGLIAITVALTVIVAMSLAVRDAPTPVPSSGLASPSPSVVPETDVTVRVGVGPRLQPGTEVEPPGRAVQSRAWQADGRWFAAFVEAVDRQTRIHVLADDGSGWSDTGVVLDERVGAMVDTLWDGEHLVVVGAVPSRSVGDGVVVRRFSLGADGRFVLDPNFPVPLTERGVRSATIARDAAGRLWVAVVQDDHVLVAHSLNDDSVWSPAAPLPGSGPVGDGDVAGVVAHGTDSIGLVWTDVADRAVWYADRLATDDVLVWSTPVRIAEDLPIADQSLSVAGTADGTIAVVYETALSRDPGAGGSDPAVIAVVHGLDGTWRSALVARVEDRVGQPIVLLDTAAPRLYVLMVGPRTGGTVYLKRTDPERPAFPAGRGLTVLSDPSEPDNGFLASTKSPIRLADDLLVLAFDDVTGTPWYALVGPPGDATGPSASPGPPDPTGSAAPPSPVRTTLASDDFEPWPVGATIGGGWELRPGDAVGTLTAVDDPAGDGRVAALRSGGEGVVRACKSFDPVVDGSVRADIRVRIGALGAQDTVITSLRDRTGEAASVRFGQGGTFAYYAGSTKVRTDIPIQSDRWYRSEVTVDLDARTYTWRLSEDDGEVLLTASDITLGEPAVSQVSQLCVQPASESSVPVLWFDAVVVSR